MRWFKFHADLINDPTLQRLPGDKFKTWINLLCITSKHDGAVSSVTSMSPVTPVCSMATATGWRQLDGG
jgi:hypothetical protein